MKIIVTILALAVLALVLNLKVAALGLALVALVILLGDIIDRQPPMPCNGTCAYGLRCEGRCVEAPR